MEAGILNDPYYRKNGRSLNIGAGEETGNTIETFEVPSDVLQMDKILLFCEGLDTIATVTINDKWLENLTICLLDISLIIKPALKEMNTITVDFTSPVSYGLERAGSTEYNIPPDCPPYYFHGECHRNMVRKMQCAFSWDWGPAFVTMGIWDPPCRRAVKVADFKSLSPYRYNDVWRLHVDVFTRNSDNIGGKGILELTLEDTDVSLVRKAKLNGGSQKLTAEFDIPKKTGIIAWWPRGYGPQTLYNLSVALKTELGILLSEKTVRFGFRTVKLVQEPISARERDGLSFYFRINDHPIFLKGSNWVPADSFPERVTKARIRNYLQSAVDANMNCLRVWGGGIYETDYFYDLADEYGILIWQDFMFACALYPANEEFLSSVREEVTYQIIRLKNHPSVFVYSGNNENEVAITGGWWPGVFRNQKLMSDYVKLYINTIQDIVKEDDPTRPFLISSPSNGVRTVMDGGISNTDPGGVLYGDIHDYQYTQPFFDDMTYKVPRMASEYGLQSFPSLESLDEVYDKRDLFYESDLNDYRQHHAGGNLQMQHLITMYMLPPESSVPHQRFEDIIYCTQIVQAIAMRTETEHYRRWQSEVNLYGEGKTMGAMYWMFADIWQAPSWSSIEYGGKWKMLHYYAYHFFSPVLISPYVSRDKLQVYVVVDELPKFQRTYLLDGKTFSQKNSKFGTFSSSWKHILLDLLKDNLEGSNEALLLLSGTVYLRVYSWDNMEPKHTEEIAFELYKPAEQVYEESVANLVWKADCGAPEHCFIVLYIGDLNNGLSTWYPLTTFKKSKGLRVPNMKVDQIMESEDRDTFEIHLITDAIAPFVWLEAYSIKGRFSDNGFLMFQAEKTIVFYAWESTDVDTLKDIISVKSLMDIYN
ncbi:beta-mannosidase-like [Mercenaria mercenaria]|uniref:beta-mannosidase-like n=1 Tax=Mercenaria mercenaria TaxID=6596 RepID=UPI00234FB2A8|nr:beta-mannosidase-like [Mercenaria mercenaria]